MLDDKELLHLQKLACINLSPEEKKKLLTQLSGIINLLDQIKNIKIDSPGVDGLLIDNSLRIIEGCKQHPDIDLLIDNVGHEKINNSLCIKSVLS